MYYQDDPVVSHVCQCGAKAGVPRRVTASAVNKAARRGLFQFVVD